MIAPEPWVLELNTVKSEEELLEAVQRYCAASHPVDLAKLPTECAGLPPGLVDDIPGLALALKRAELACAGPDDATGVLCEMARLFALASEQLRALRGHRPMTAWRPHRSYYGP